MKKHFNKNLVMAEEEEHLFQQSDTCWICKNQRMPNDRATWTTVHQRQ